MPSAAIFRAAVLDIQDLQELVPLVDPRPVRIGDYEGPSENDYYEDSDGTVRERTRVLAEMGIPVAAGLPLIPNCHGLLSAPPGQRIVHGCPEERTVVVLADTIRRGPMPGQWTLRVLPTIYRPGVGREATVTDLVLARRGDVIAVVDRQYLGLFERE